MAGAVAWRTRTHTVRARLGGTGDRVDRRALAAGQGTHRATVRHPARPSGERNASRADRHSGAGQPLPGDDLLALLAAALCGATCSGGPGPPAPGAYPAPGGNS